jgi:hypothetical protein
MVIELSGTRQVFLKSFWGRTIDSVFMIHRNKAGEGMSTPLVQNLITLEDTG